MLRKKVSQLRTGHTGTFIIIKIIDGDDSTHVLVFLYMFDIHTRKTQYRVRIISYIVFVTCAQELRGAMLGITVRSGKMLHVQMNRKSFLPYTVSTLCDNDLLIKITWCLNFPVTENISTAESERLTARKEV